MPQTSTSPRHRDNRPDFSRTLEAAAYWEPWTHTKNPTIAQVFEALNYFVNHPSSRPSWGSLQVVASNALEISAEAEAKALLLEIPYPTLRDFHASTLKLFEGRLAQDAWFQKFEKKLQQLAILHIESQWQAAKQPQAPLKTYGQL